MDWSVCCMSSPLLLKVSACWLLFVACRCLPTRPPSSSTGPAQSTDGPLSRSSRSQSGQATPSHQEQQQGWSLWHAVQGVQAVGQQVSSPLPWAEWEREAAEQPWQLRYSTRKPGRHMDRMAPCGGRMGSRMCLAAQCSMQAVRYRPVKFVHDVNFGTLRTGCRQWGGSRCQAPCNGMRRV
jgi:hypothetical protein